MNISDKGLELIKESEGCRLASYQDSVGVWTIGYGHTGKHIHAHMHITNTEAEELLREDVAKFEAAVNRMVTVAVNQKQFDALVDFAFNLGAHALHGSTLLKLLNKGEYKLAAEQFPRWVHAGKQVLPGLVKRREREKEMFLS